MVEPSFAKPMLYPSRKYQLVPRLKVTSFPVVGLKTEV